MKTRAMVRIVLGATLLLAACMTLTAQAQQAAYPSRSVRMIIPAAPGGNPDLLARMLSQKLADAFGKPFIVENVPGAGGGGSKRAPKQLVSSHISRIGSGPLDSGPVAGHYPSCQRGTGPGPTGARRP